MTNNQRILLIVSGGVAAYKSLDLIRLLKTDGFRVRCILTENGSKFVTPLSLETLSEEKVYQDMFSLTEGDEIGHIELSRDSELIVVAPATANIIAKMRSGIANDLATTTLLATTSPIMIAPAMNVRMWKNLATQENIETLRNRGITLIGPVEGDMACGEHGMGRMSDPTEIAKFIKKKLGPPQKMFATQKECLPSNLIDKKVLITSGPTYEPIDPVRYIANRSSGRQGHAIARAFSEHGAETVLVSGPTDLEDPVGVTVNKVSSAVEMLAACKGELPVDILVCSAAVSDWRVVSPAKQKIKRNGLAPSLELMENPDILTTLSRSKTNRPSLVIGFAAETDSIVEKAVDKLNKKGCDWIIANDVSLGTGVFGGKENTVYVVDQNGIENWPKMSKDLIGKKLVEKVSNHLASS